MILKQIIEKETPQQRYTRTHPWAKHKMWAQSRAKRLGVPFILTVDDVYRAWHRDSAANLKQPSIDRIKPVLGYIPSNIRFIEHRRNVRRAGAI